MIEQKRIVFTRHKFDESTGEFEGYASVFGNVDSYNDVVEKGAFERFLASGWDRVKILALHNDEWLPIGIPLELREDDYGLFLRAKISDTSLGRDIRTLMRDGVLNELSIGYITLDSFSDKGVRHLTELELQEISVVTWAANELAKVTDVKAALLASKAGYILGAIKANRPYKLKRRR